MPVADAEKRISLLASGKGTKRCSKCRKEKPRDQFYKNVGSRDGLTYWCKLCVKLYQSHRRCQPSRPSITCSECGEVKPETEFSRKAGGGHICNTCSAMGDAVKRIGEKINQENPIALSTWEQVGSAVRQLAEDQAFINKELVVAKRKIDLIKSDVSPSVLAHAASQGRLRAAITAFVEAVPKKERGVWKRFRFGAVLYRRGKLYISLNPSLAANCVGKP